MTASAEMPNGHQGSRAEWDRMEAPLLRLDPILEAFARESGLELLRNERGHPNRAFRWGTPISRLIQIFGSDSDDILWNLWICASEDRGAKRYLRSEYLARDADLATLEAGLEKELRIAFDRVKSWGPEDLDFATRLS